jgi:hypothetical protein
MAGDLSSIFVIVRQRSVHIIEEGRAPGLLEAIERQTARPGNGKVTAIFRRR